MNAMSAVLSSMTPQQTGPQNARGDEARGETFARCLDQACESDPPEPNPASERPERAAAKPNSGREAAGARKADAGAAKAVPPEDGKAGDATVESDRAAADAAPAARDEAAAPDLAALLPGWSPPSPVVAASSGASAASATDGTDALQDVTAAIGEAPASPLREHALSPPPTPNEATPARSMASASDGAATATTPSSAQLQAAASEHKETAPATSATAAPTLPAGAFAAVSATPTTTAAKAAEAALPTAAVQAAIDTPAFAPSLATQVRWWANDGVQQAQLLLNPAEMGPVAVKIVLDGREARIDFSADMAATRSAIEGALPALAAALDESGLKLSGGGVHDGAAQRQPAWNAHSVMDRTVGHGAEHVGEPAGHAAGRRHAPSRGIVDLVA